jgi:hypothetical protein
MVHARELTCAAGVAHDPLDALVLAGETCCSSPIGRLRPRAWWTALHDGELRARAAASCFDVTPLMIVSSKIICGCSIVAA